MAITIPNGVAAEVRHRLVDLDVDGLVALNARIVKRSNRVMPPNGSIEAYAQQRHYNNQSSPAITDAKVSFNLETSLPHGEGRVRHQSEWTKLFASLLRRKKANIQFGYVAMLPWGTTGIDSRESIRLIADAWCAMEPLLDVLRGKVTAKSLVK